MMIWCVSVVAVECEEVDDVALGLFVARFKTQSRKPKIQKTKTKLILYMSMPFIVLSFSLFLCFCFFSDCYVFFFLLLSLSIALCLKRTLATQHIPLAASTLFQFTPICTYKAGMQPKLVGVWTLGLILSLLCACVFRDGGEGVDPSSSGASLLPSNLSSPPKI